MATPWSQTQASSPRRVIVYPLTTSQTGNNDSQSAVQVQQRCVQNPAVPSGITQYYTGPVTQYFAYFGHPGTYTATFNDNRYGNSQQGARMEGPREVRRSPSQGYHSSGSTSPMSSSSSQPRYPY